MLAMAPIYALPLSLVSCLLFFPVGAPFPQNSNVPESERKSYEGYKVYRLKPDSTGKLAVLQDLYENDTSLMLDFWEAPSAKVAGVDVMVSPDSRDKFLNLLNSSSIYYEVRVPNMQDVLNKERESAKFSQSLARDAFGTTPTFNFRVYHSYDEIVRQMRTLEEQYRDIVEVFTIGGQTWEGRQLTVIKIGNRQYANDPNRPIFWLDGGIHAREWISPAVAMFMMNELVTKYATDPAIQNYVNSMDWVILPVFNPDGYEYSRTRDRMWRKNRNPNGNAQPQYCRGVDLNRNFDWHFGGKGSSFDPCKEIFNGKSAFSEPESQAVRDFILQNRDRMRAYITLHSFSQIWMYPFGHEYNERSADWLDLKAVAERGANKLKSFYGTNYVVDTGANALYPAAGGSDDWSKGVAGVKFVYLLELRPDDNSVNSQYAFSLPESQIYPTAMETWAGLRVVADEVIQRFAAGAVLQPTTNAPLPQPVTQAGGSVGCQDREPYCAWWSSLGACQAWAADMRYSCPRSCGVCNTVETTAAPVVCEDQRTDCASWLRMRLCDWVSYACQRTCARC